MVLQDLKYRTFQNLDARLWMIHKTLSPLPLQTKQGRKESEESESDSESDSDSEGEGREDDEGQKQSARIVLLLNTPLRITESVATEETLQSTHKVKTGLNPIKDPVVALTPPASGHFK